MIRSFMMKLMFLTHGWYRIAGTMQLRNQTQKETFNSIKMMIKLLFSDFRCYLFLLRVFFHIVVSFGVLHQLYCNTQPRSI